MRLARVATRSLVVWAELFTAFSKNHSRSDILSKLRLRLVSNQSAAAALTAALDAALAVIDEAERTLSTDEIAKKLPANAARDIRRLSKAANLAPRRFADFLSLLDLSESGAASRAIQEVELAKELRKSLPDEYEAATDRIYRRIEKEALPEAEFELGLTRATILATFGIDSPEALFPVPARFEQIEDPVQGADLAALATAVRTAQTCIVVHGDAGVGKTTTLLQLQEALPSGSIAIAYDCFGSGSYLDPAEARHLPDRAVYQLVNELAVRCGTPLLLRPPRSQPDLWRVFRQRLEEAAAALDGDRLLVVVIDAADNAVFAARQNHEQCFVHRLWHLEIPSNVRLVVSARTHRVADLRAPAGTPELSLTGFAPTESTVYLRRRFQDASPEKAEAFHENSGGNPRVQFYVLDPERSPGPDGRYRDCGCCAHA